MDETRGERLRRLSSNNRVNRYSRADLNAITNKEEPSVPINQQEIVPQRENLALYTVSNDSAITDSLYGAGITVDTEDSLEHARAQGWEPAERQPLIKEYNHGPENAVKTDGSSDVETQEASEEETVEGRVVLEETEQETSSCKKEDAFIDSGPEVIQSGGMYKLRRSDGQKDYVYRYAYRTEESCNKMKSLIDYWNKIPTKTEDGGSSFDEEIKEEEPTKSKAERSTVIALANYIDAENLFLGWCTHCRKFVEENYSYGKMTGLSANYRTEEKCPVCRNNTLYGATISAQMNLISVPGLRELERAVEEEDFDVFGLENLDY